MDLSDVVLLFNDPVTFVSAPVVVDSVTFVVEEVVVVVVKEDGEPASKQIIIQDIFT